MLDESCMGFVVILVLPKCIFVDDTVVTGSIEQGRGNKRFQNEPTAVRDTSAMELYRGINTFVPQVDPSNFGRTIRKAECDRALR